MLGFLPSLVGRRGAGSVSLVPEVFAVFIAMIVTAVVVLWSTSSVDIPIFSIVVLLSLQRGHDTDNTAGTNAPPQERR